jgi:polar amino acid transport system substrate-binding protein
MWIRFLLLVSAFILLHFGLVFGAEKVKLSSVEWPPYSGEKLPEGGASVKVVKAAFAAMGYEVVVEFYPWQRAVDMAKQGKTAGYFPEYYAQHIEKEFIFSERIGNSPLGFIESVKSPITWSTLNDLKGKIIGVVSGYVNTEDLDSMIASGTLTSDQSPNDETLIRKVAAGRINVAVMDRYVFEYLLANNPTLASSKGLVRFNERLLDEKGIFICFPRNPEGEKLVKIFNEGIKRIDLNSIMKQYFEK